MAQCYRDLFGGRDTVESELAATELHEGLSWLIAFVKAHRKEK